MPAFEKACSQTGMENGIRVDDQGIYQYLIAPGITIGSRLICGDPVKKQFSSGRLAQLGERCSHIAGVIGLNEFAHLPVHYFLHYLYNLICASAVARTQLPRRLCSYRTKGP